MEVRQASQRKLSSDKEDYVKSNSKEKSWLADNSYAVNIYGGMETTNKDMLLYVDLDIDDNCLC